MYLLLQQGRPVTNVFQSKSYISNKFAFADYAFALACGRLEFIEFIKQQSLIMIFNSHITNGHFKFIMYLKQQLLLLHPVGPPLQ